MRKYTHQIYGIDANNQITHAGPRRCRAMDLKTAYRIERSWQAWRRWYLLQHPGKYPLCTDLGRTVTLHVHPMDNPNAGRIFSFGNLFTK